MVILLGQCLVHCMVSEKEEYLDLMMREIRMGLYLDLQMVRLNVMHLEHLMEIQLGLLMELTILLYSDERREY